ncbi:MAG: hypothetical protein Q4F11_03945, partial [Eubacteriales bacterium]|nr:hypothetical protein [Eubacteriales bacterium]
MITAVENVVMLVPAGLLGVGTAFVTGKLICSFIEKNMGIQFYQVEISAVLKGLLSILIALALWELVTLFVWLKETKAVDKTKKKASKIQKFNAPKRAINQGNLTFRMHIRMMKSNGIAMNVGIRVFLSAVCLCLVVCVLFFLRAYTEYEKNNNRPDLIGYQTNQDSDFMYEFSFFNNFISYLDYNRLTTEKFYMDEMQYLKDDYNNNISKYVVNISYEQLNKSFENKDNRLTGIGGEPISNSY